jgi:signal transduction histidine kinase
MASPETIEFLSFRRTFTLLILLVVLPSAGVSAFGIVAIVNERDIVEKRIEGIWASRLATLQSDLKGQLDAVQGTPSDGGLALQAGGVPLCETGFEVVGGAVKSPDARLNTLVNGLGAELDRLPLRPVVFSIVTPQGTSLLATMRDGERVVGCQVKVESLERLFAAQAARVTATDPGRFDLEPLQRDTAQGVMARFAEAREAALGPRELASLTLASPLQDFRLVARALGEDPVVRASTRNRIWYGVLLTLFYITLALGVIYTGRTLYREAQLSRLKTDFVSLVSHELRTPLTSIRMFIDTLAMGRVTDPTEMQTVLDLLSKETTRLSGMIESVLDWSRIESGKKQYQRVVTPVSAIIETADRAFRTQRLGQAMNYELDAPEGLPTVDVDRDAVSGALLNLLQNAFKYTGDDKQIRLRARVDGEQVVLEVADNGMGIPRRELRKIFDHFYRADNLLTRQTEGSGLGLAIAQRIVKAHGGRISVDSTVGQGSTFRIHLPIVTT